MILGPDLMSWIADSLLAGLVLTAAVLTITAKETFTASVGFIVAGLLLGLVWIRLDAPDIALIEVAIGGGASGVLVLLVAPRLSQSPEAEPGARSGPGAKVAAGVLAAGFAALIAAAMLSLPERAPSLGAAVVAEMPATGLGNAVTGVLLAFRSFDTLLEKLVLLLALLAVWSLAPEQVARGIPGPVRRVPPFSALDLLARVLPPLGVVIGIHLVWAGADHPGGAFQGGTLLGAMWALIWLAGFSDPPLPGSTALRVALLTGPVAFMLIGLLGLAAAGNFLAYPDGFAKPLILLLEAAMTVSVAATVAMLLAGPPERLPAPPASNAG